MLTVRRRAVFLPPRRPDDGSSPRSRPWPIRGLEAALRTATARAAIRRPIFLPWGVEEPPLPPPERLTGALIVIARAGPAHRGGWRWQPALRAVPPAPAPERSHRLLVLTGNRRPAAASRGWLRLPARIIVPPEPAPERALRWLVEWRVAARASATARARSLVWQPVPVLESTAAPVVDRVRSSGGIVGVRSRFGVRVVAQRGGVRR